MSEARSERTYILNTRPALNFLGIDRLDVLTATLGTAIYLSPSVLDEIREHIVWTRRDFDGRVRQSPETIDPEEIAFVENLDRHDSQLRPSRLRLLQRIELSELVLSEGYMRTGRLDPGESEVLAVARRRGWVVVIDEFVGHCHAEADGIANECTLSILVRAVTQARFDSEEVSKLWGRMQYWWDYAPSRSLTDYLAGSPIWPACPQDP